MQSDRQTRQAAGTSDVNGALLTLICPDNHFQTSLSNALSFLLSLCLHDPFLSRPPLSLSPLLSLNVSSSCTHLSHLFLVFSLISHNCLFSLCFASLQPAEKQGEREVVCVCVSVKWALYSSPSSKKLSLEWAGNNPCGLVQSNCNPQHIITMAGSPLHRCSRAGAGGAPPPPRSHTHTLPFICYYFHCFASVFLDSPYITWPAPIMNPSEKARTRLLSCIIQSPTPTTHLTLLLHIPHSCHPHHL